jgi:uncharacterized membrane protein
MDNEMSTTESLIAAIKAIGDAASFSIALGTLVQILPPLAAIVSILWIGFQFYHSAPVTEWRKRRKEQHARNS